MADLINVEDTGNDVILHFYLRRSRVEFDGAIRAEINKAIEIEAEKLKDAIMPIINKELEDIGKAIKDRVVGIINKNV